MPDAGFGLSFEGLRRGAHTALRVSPFGFFLVFIGATILRACAALAYARSALREGLRWGSSEAGCVVGKGKVINIALFAMLAVGLCLLLYPTVSDWWNSTRQSRAIASYVDAVDNLDTSRQDALLAEARAYNESLADHAANGALDEWALSQYENLLDVTGTGIMGYVEIPVLHCSLPIYHGTDEGVLQVAVGHLEWTSLPVGGEGTHCAISGHRGLPSAKLFTNLDQLVEGDVFELHVLGETLVYEVDQIRIVEPADIAELSLQSGQDLCTLVTCTPYGINTHRLLVRGHRVDAADSLAVAADAVRVDPATVATIVAVPVLLVALVALLVHDARRRGRRKALKAAWVAVGGSGEAAVLAEEGMGEASSGAASKRGAGEHAGGNVSLG